MNKLADAIKNRSLKTEDLCHTVRGFEDGNTSSHRQQMTEGQMNPNRHIPNRLTGESEVTRYDPYGRVITGGIGHLVVSTPSAMSDVHVGMLLRSMEMPKPLFHLLTEEQVLHLLKEEAHKMAAEKKAKNKRRRQHSKAVKKARRK